MLYCENSLHIRPKSGIRYLYLNLIAHGDENADHDIYLVDDAENPIYETGYYKEREAELMGTARFFHQITVFPAEGENGLICTEGGRKIAVPSAR